MLRLAEPPVIGSCAWCEQPAVETIEVEPALHKTTFAVYANVCPAHLDAGDREGATPIRDLRRAQANRAIGGE
jgi:hypothetical protein